jgi:hypothetical protein
MATNYPRFWDRDETELWSTISVGHLGDYGPLHSDQYAQNLFSVGWVEDVSDSMRKVARNNFMDYAIENGYFSEVEDFDWMAWREYMGY